MIKYVRGVVRRHVESLKTSAKKLESVAFDLRQKSATLTDSAEQYKDVLNALDSHDVY